MPWPPAAIVPETREVNDPIPPSNDINLHSAWMNEAKGIPLLDLQEAKQKFVQTTKPLTLVPSDTEPVLTGPEQIWIPTAAGAFDESGFFADRATSQCNTLPPFMINNTLTVVNGGANAALAVVKETKTYTQIRFLLTGWTTAPTDAYAVVWSDTGQALGSTANLASQMTAAGLLITGTLKAPVQLSASTKVYLGVVFIGGSGLTVARGTFANAVTGYALIQNLLPNPISVSMTGQGSFPSTGAPPTLSFATKSSNVPWVELI